MSEAGSLNLAPLIPSLAAFIGRRNGRKVQHQLLMGAVLTGCMLLGIVSATVPSTSRTSTIIKVWERAFISGDSDVS